MRASPAVQVIFHRESLLGAPQPPQNGLPTGGAMPSHRPVTTPPMSVTVQPRILRPV